MSGDQGLRYWHGGAPGLGVGASLLPSPPHFVDGCPICEAKRRGIQTIIDPLTARPDRIYITIDKEYARFYASKYPHGDLYLVTPQGPIEPSPEDHFPSWVCESAQVVAVYNRRIELSWHERRRLFRRWTIADFAHRPSSLPVMGEKG